MFLNIIVGFVIPWIFGIYLILKNKKIIILFAPIGGFLSYIAIGVDELTKYWKLYPFNFSDTITALPFCLGLYPMNACLIIYLINDKKFNPYGALALISLITTIEEGLGFMTGRVVYDNGWNIFFTYISYIVPFTLVYISYVYIKKLKLI